MLAEAERMQNAQIGQLNRFEWRGAHAVVDELQHALHRWLSPFCAGHAGTGILFRNKCTSVSTGFVRIHALN